MRKLGICLIVFLLVTNMGCSPEVGLKDHGKVQIESLYSWNRELLANDGSLGYLLKDLQVQRVYQGIYPEEFSNGIAKQYVENAKSNGVSLSYLIGDPNWEYADTVIQWALEPLVSYNDAIDENDKIKEVVLDIEFFNTHQFTTGEIGKFLRMHEGIYLYAKQYDLDVVLCIPYWLLESLDSEESERLLASADRISLSIFLVGQEESIYGNLKEKLEGKVVDVIFETQKTSERYGVKSINTYHEKGFESLKEEMSRFQKQFLNTSISLHHLSSLLELELK